MLKYSENSIFRQRVCTIQETEYKDKASFTVKKSPTKYLIRYRIKLRSVFKGNLLI